MVPPKPYSERCHASFLTRPFLGLLGSSVPARVTTLSYWGQHSSYVGFHAYLTRPFLPGLVLSLLRANLDALCFPSRDPTGGYPPDKPAVFPSPGSYAFVLDPIIISK